MGPHSGAPAVFLSIPWGQGEYFHQQESGPWTMVVLRPQRALILSEMQVRLSRPFILQDKEPKTISICRIRAVVSSSLSPNTAQALAPSAPGLNGEWMALVASAKSLSRRRAEPRHSQQNLFAPHGHSVCGFLGGCRIHQSL